MTVELSNTLAIHAAPAAVFDYVTQPWRWHEWHPNSKSARASVPVLAAGDTFDETIELKPLAPLPPTLVRQTHYQVLVSEPRHHWRVRGETADGWLEIDYRFAPTAEGTRFTRTLTFDASGLTRLLLPALKRNMARTSEQALANLKQVLEAG